MARSIVAPCVDMSVSPGMTGVGLPCVDVQASAGTTGLVSGSGLVTGSCCAVAS